MGGEVKLGCWLCVFKQFCILICMLTALDAPIDQLDIHEKDFVAKIREHGWFCTHVFEEDDLPSFTYSTGFFLKFGKPEILIFSTKQENAHQIIWNIYRDLEDGKDLPVNQMSTGIMKNLPVAVFSVAEKHYREHFGWSMWFYGGEPFPAAQIVWPDRSGNFPWERSFDEEFIDLQPDLTELGWVKELNNLS
jgi:Domain of unknown function (DUF4262)